MSDSAIRAGEGAARLKNKCRIKNIFALKDDWKKWGM